MLEALRTGVSMRRVALYEVPFIVDDTHALADTVRGQLDEPTTAWDEPTAAGPEASADSGMSGCDHAADAKSGGDERCRLKSSGDVELDTLNRERRRGSGRYRCGAWTPRHQRPIRAAAAGVDQQSRDPVGHGI